MNIFVEIGLLVGIAAAISLVMRALRQPLMIGYIITGFLVGPYVFNIARSQEIIQTFSELGIALLLFIVGLNLSPRVLKEVGWVSLISGMGQIIFTALIGYFIVSAFGFATIPAWYISVALTFSSTIIVLKLLSDKGDLEKLYGKVSVGFLILQDIVATLVLIGIGSFTGGGDSIAQHAFELFIKGAVATGVLMVVGWKVLPRLNKLLGNSQEVLFMFSLGWGLSIAALFYWMGLSVEVGALIAGVALAVSPYHHEISARLRPLRDFFVVIFFIFLGSQLSVGDAHAVMVPALVLSLFVLIGNPLIVMAVMGLMGYRKRTSFLTGLALAQVSEFSLILVILGIKSGHISQSVLSLVTIVAIITIAASSYIIPAGDDLYRRTRRYLNIFEKKRISEADGVGEGRVYETILFGCNRVGYDFLDVLERDKRDLLVVDYDPDVIAHLRARGVACRYGDMDDPELLDELRLFESKMIISTVPDFESSMLLLQKIRPKNPDAIIILTSHDIDEANFLYAKGASYVIMPHFLGSTYASEMVQKNGFAHDNFAFERAKHLSYLAQKKQRGHKHPHLERYNL